MIRNALFIVLLILVNSVSFAQLTLNDSLLANKLMRSYAKCSLQDREWVYTHLNKSAYIQGDDIWFTTYILNPVNKLLNPETSKLYVELWSPEKKLLSRKILYVKEGLANHYIHLPDTLSPGSYCFRTYTNWMRNFYAENDLNTYITVLGHEKVYANETVVKHFNKSDDVRSQTAPIIVPDSIPGYDIQFLPESGTFLIGADNIIGVKVIDPYGHGIKISGNVFLTDDQAITTFSTNASGMDSFIIPNATGGQYKAKVTLPDGTELELLLPKAVHEGVILHIYPFRPELVWIKVQTNETNRKLNKPYLLLLHANGIIFNAYHIIFPAENAIQIKVNKKNLGYGIIYATVFNENGMPVAERIFYNQNTNSRGNLTVTNEHLANDTLSLNINITDSLHLSKLTNLSISVLPGESHLNNFKNSLFAESILRPALRGNIENPNSFFEVNDTRHSVAIDNLLLTQGWRKYNWPAILKDSVPQFTYNFENGFTVEGKVKNWFKNKAESNSQITLFSMPNDLILWSPVDTSGIFKFESLFLKDSTWLVASASSNKNKNWNRKLELAIPESIMETPDIRPLPSPPASDNSKEIIGDIPQLTKGTILLKEVMVTSQKKSPFSDNPYISSMDDILTLTKENYMQFVDMEMLLAAKFNIRVEKTSDGESHFNMGRGSISFSESPVEPIMMIDGIKVREPQDILNFAIEMVEAVAVNKNGFGGGMGGAAGTIAIKSRATPFFVNGAEPVNIKRITVNGYAPPVKYFEPKYVIPPTSADYERYATVFWKPDLVIDSTKTGSLRFFAPKSIKTISLRIEGISTEGKIYFHEQKIEIPGRD